ncbi:MAG: DUF349 domain-containing protein [Pseudomonadota bacterium]
MEANKHQTPADAAALSTRLKALKSTLDELLTSKDGIDESRAKSLRKEWEALENEHPDSETASELATSMSKLRDRIHLQVERREAQFSDVERLLVSLREAVKTGDLKSAQDSEQNIISGLNRIFGLSSQRRQKIIQELEQVRPKMQELTDWRHWGTTKAREKVIEEIRHIHQNEKDLEKVANRITEARNEWREWDKSGEGGDHRLYKEFDQICSEAYEACAKHFENQKRLRREATQSRTRCCTKLEEAFESTQWRTPDWKAIQKLVRGELQFWRKHRQAEFKHRKALQMRFDAAIEKFDERLDRERKRNLKNREQLIEQIENLKQEEDIRQAMNQLIELKAKWNVTVNSGRKKEQAVWSRFTKACDAIYDLRRQERQSEQKTQLSNLKLKEAICAEAEDYAKGTRAAEVSFSSQLAQWQQRWEDAGFVPKKDIGRIEKRFKNALSKAKSFNTSERVKSRQQSDQLLKQKAELCEDIENAVFSGDFDRIDVGGIKDRWSTVEDADSIAEEHITRRFELAVSALSDASLRQRLMDERRSNLGRLQNLLLQIEIATESDTPPEYAKDRMQMQISRLSTAMGKSDNSNLIAESELYAQYLLTGAVDPADRESCNARFAVCSSKLKALM